MDHWQSQAWEEFKIWLGEPTSQALRRQVLAVIFANDYEIEQFFLKMGNLGGRSQLDIVSDWKRIKSEWSKVGEERFSHITSKELENLFWQFFFWMMDTYVYHYGQMNKDYQAEYHLQMENVAMCMVTETYPELAVPYVPRVSN